MRFITILLFIAQCSFAQNIRIATYNVENLFDTINAPASYDNEFTPTGKSRWTSEKYRSKAKKLRSVITAIAPSAMGICEVENATVLHDIMPDGFRYVHYDSPDLRGIDVALIYNPQKMTIVRSEPINVSDRYRTRDILRVDAEVGELPFTILVVHLPSRRGNSAAAAVQRANIHRMIDSIATTIPNVIVCGDFNMNPSRTLLSKLYNTAERPYQKGSGSYAYHDIWQMYDQIFISYSLKPYLQCDATVYRSVELIEERGRFTGYPRKGVPSDHLALYVDLVISGVRSAK